MTNLEQILEIKTGCFLALQANLLVILVSPCETWPVCIGPECLVLFSGATFLPFYCVFREGKDYVVMFKKLGKQLPFAKCLNGGHRMLFSALGNIGLHPSGCSSHLVSLPPSRTRFHLLLLSREWAAFRHAAGWDHRFPNLPSTPCSQTNLQYSATKHHRKKLMLH